ncbi:hypothetical protein IRJ41_019367 [Triplophysa rosa]|uniref:Uncharacterized protein n=1 Tax=Triplophysa rosa TaxID=992332 RepID=A0A9W7TU10_TRIRA|nr:hypothetical protein IRJ41_019367 [Triplophysa rosa]
MDPAVVPPSGDDIQPVSWADSIDDAEYEALEVVIPSWAVLDFSTVRAEDPNASPPVQRRAENRVDLLPLASIKGRSVLSERLHQLSVDLLLQSIFLDRSAMSERVHQLSVDLLPLASLKGRSVLSERLHQLGVDLLLHGTVIDRSAVSETLHLLSIYLLPTLTLGPVSWTKGSAANDRDLHLTAEELGCSQETPNGQNREAAK